MKRYSPSMFPNESDVFRKSIAISYSKHIPILQTVVASLGRQFEMYGKAFRHMFPHKSPLNAPHPAYSWNYMQRQSLSSVLSLAGKFQMNSMPIPELVSDPLTGLVTHKGSKEYAKPIDNITYSVKEGLDNTKYNKLIAISEHKRDEVPIGQVNKQKLEATNGLRLLQVASEERIKENINDMVDNILRNTKRMLKKSKIEGKNMRKRKTSSQIAILKKELLGSERVPREKIIELANETGLSKDQVYKWYWDKRQKKN
eukprot:TRINITY_DN3926_c0_g1_i11.p1 TRINITY_DN3926_c0_g1~~TRINITY_DN3926_c0_g1_i11.p1  ORF type:complete len:257 (+),score=27.03 TRINITY_DN3926_c0_g1_i11:35-805(+)